MSSGKKLMSYVFEAEKSGKKVELYFVEPDTKEETIYVAVVLDVGDDCIFFDSYDDEGAFIAKVVKKRDHLSMVVIESIEMERERLKGLMKED